MLKQMSAVLVMGLMIGPAMAWAQEQQPQVQEAPQVEPAPQVEEAPESTIPADQSTPKGTLRLLAEAMEEGNREQLLPLLHAETETEERMAEAMVGIAEAVGRLRRAAVEAFGEEGAIGLTGDVRAATAEGLVQLEAAEEHIDGDRAEVTTDEPGAPAIVLVRVDEQWKMPMSEMEREIEPGAVDRTLEEIALQAEVVTETAAEIEQGQYETAEQAAQALHGKMVRAAMERMEQNGQPMPQPQPEQQPQPQPEGPMPQGQ